MTVRAGRGRPMVLAVTPDPVFATYHGSAVSKGATGVLICPPWGWDEVTSYRSIRAWAEALAAAGVPTLRIDLPGTGDSGGRPSDPDRVAAWTTAVASGLTWLSDRPEVARVAAIGLGIGGLIVGAAIDAGAPVDELVLWGTPDTGRAWVREQRAFAALQASRIEVSGGTASGAPSGGWMEVGGFVLSADTTAALGRLALASTPTARLRRVLVLDRDGMATSARFAAAVSRDGVDLTSDAGPGWADMVFHPEQYAAPNAVIDRVTHWLTVEGCTGDDPMALTAPRQGHDLVASRETPTPPVADDVMVLNHEAGARDGRAIRETAVAIERRFGDLFGVLSEPLDGSRERLCAVFLNAGAVRRIGPNRLWVETARRWAARGVPSIRMDLEGIGDADGDPGRYRDVGNFYTEEVGAQVDAILDDLEQRGYGPKFVLVGLCAGGYWAFHTGAKDRRVVAALILNPRAIIWDDGLLARRDAEHADRLFAAGTWRRVLRGDVTIQRALAVARAIAGRTVRAIAGVVRGNSGEPGTADLIVRLLDDLSANRTRVLIGFSGDEPVHDELEAYGILGRLHRWPNLAVRTLPGADHTLRPIPAQDAATAMLDAELDRLLDPA